MSQETLDKIYTHHKKIQNMESIAGVLYWDFETNMPKGSGGLRSDQLALINASVHNLSTDGRYVENVMSLDTSKLANKTDQQHITKLQKNLGRSLCIDEDFVQKETVANLKCQEQWGKAREAKSFALVKNELKTLVELRREYTERLMSYAPLKKHYVGKNAYEALLDIFEPGISSDYLRDVLKTLVSKTVELLPAIEAKQKSLSRVAPIQMKNDDQHQVVLKVAKALGFDFERGRIDKSIHPFCGGHPMDTRMTTRYSEDDATYSLWSTIHETGHGIYEQSLPAELIGLPCGTAASMGVHESQSRFYENQIARSLPFCEWLAPSLGVTPAHLHQTLNGVERSLVRTESDEVTYNLHIYLRFELEEQLILGKLSVDDLEEAWNERIKTTLGLTPPSALEGVLQDTHWYSGLFGYFPTYSLGNLLAAELFETYSQEFPQWQDLVRAGSFAHIKEFMNQRVHKLAALEDSPTTMQHILGGKLPQADTLVNYFKHKYL